MQVHRPSTFIFLIFTAGSYELEKDVMKKEMKNYRKADTELKIAIKKLRFNPVTEAFGPMKMNKKVHRKGSEN